MREITAFFTTKEIGTDVREKYQYGTSLSLDDNIYQELLELARKVMGRAKELVEQDL